MNITTEQRDGITILHLDGELDANAADTLVAAAGECLNQRGDRLIIELSQVPFISSPAIGALVRITAQANTEEQTAVLASPTALIENVFNVTQLDRFFQIFPSLDEAIAHLKGS